MKRFEYKLELAPQKRKRYSGLTRSDDVFAMTMMDTINEVARDGWEFLRLETMSESQRSGLFGRKIKQHEYLVYRRPLHTNGMSIDTQMSPRRVKPANVLNIEQLRARMHQAGEAEAAV